MQDITNPALAWRSSSSGRGSGSQHVCWLVGVQYNGGGKARKHIDIFNCCAHRKAGGARAGDGALGTYEVMAEDTGICSGSEGSTDPMSTGNEFLDRALVLHLNNCNLLLLVSVNERYSFQGGGHPWVGRDGTESEH